MGSSEKYWQYARECVRLARKAEKVDDKDMAVRMAKAWINVAMVEDDVAVQAAAENQAKPVLHS
jgi:hypothetical protein